MNKWMITAVLAGLFSMPVLAENVSEKAKAKRFENMEYLVYIEVPMRNFGTDAQKQTLAEIRKDYAKALSFFLEGDYVQSYVDFIGVQKKLELLYEEMSLSYINRTSEILGSVTNKVVDINIIYNKKSFNSRRFLRKRDISAKPPQMASYETTDFHFTYDKKAITDNLDYGYENLGEAKRVRQEAMDLDKYLENNKPVTPDIRKKRLENYMAVIRLCRDGKLNAINSFQLIQRYENYGNQEKFKDNYFAEEKNINPVFDQRIPEAYRVDASDSFNRVHAEEVCLKFEMKPAKECKKVVEN